MGGELETPNLEKKPIDEKNNFFRYGSNRVQGFKKSLDVFNIYENIKQLEEKNIYIFGIFDGHSGKEISQYLSENFCKELLKNENFIIEHYQKALIETFINMDNSLRKEEVNNTLKEILQKNRLKNKEKINNFFKENNNDLNEEDLNDINTFMDILDPNNLEDVLISDYMGSSGLIILIEKNLTYIANAGNSHFIIINKHLEINNKILEKQKNEEIEEKKRIKIVKGIKYGKQIKSEKYIYTRGFGDFQFKINNLINIDTKEILSEPFLYEINNKDVKYIIAFNDGVYENFKFINNIEKDKNDIYKMISDYFIEHLKDEKPISSIISDLFENNLINLKIEANNKNNIRNVVANNLSCTIIEFFS